MKDLHRILPATMAVTALAALPVAAMADDYTPGADMDTGAEAPAPSGAEMGGMADIQGQIEQIETLAQIDNVTVIELGGPGAGAPAEPGMGPDEGFDDDLGAAPGAGPDDGFDDDLAAAPDDDLTAPETEPGAEPGGQAEPGMDAGAEFEGEAGAEMDIAPETGTADPGAAEPGTAQPDVGEPGAADAPTGLPQDDPQLSELHNAIEGNQELADELAAENVDVEDVVAVEIMGAGDVVVYVQGS